MKSVGCLKKYFRGILISLVLASGFLTVSGQVLLATHETDHRYTVYGIVEDKEGHPRANVRVMVTHDKTGDGNTVFTDQNGYYEVLLHLHNNNLGDEVLVKAEGETKTIHVTFDPSDRTTERKHEVNVQIGGKEPARKAGLFNYIAGGLFSVGLFGFILIYLRQRKLAQ